MNEQQAACKLLHDVGFGGPLALWPSLIDECIELRASHSHHTWES